MYLSMMMVISIKQHLNKIWSPIHEKVKQQWGWVQKSVAYKKSVYWKRVFFKKGNSQTCTCEV